MLPGGSNLFILRIFVTNEISDGVFMTIISKHPRQVVLLVVAKSLGLKIVLELSFILA